MKHKLWLVFRIAASVTLIWLIAAVCEKLGSNRSTSAMLLLLAVLAIATLGDRVLALIASVAASLAFTYYFVDQTGNRAISNVQSVITLATMVLTAFTGSHLALRAQQRAREAIRRREEMERLNQLGRVLIAAHTVPEAAGSAVRKLVELFGLDGAVLRVEGALQDFQAGKIVGGGPVSVMRANVDGRADILELHGSQPSEEVRNAIAGMIGLVLERARSAEERARMEAAARGEELRSTVLNALAHNFKTPLTSIKAAASVLRSAADLPPAGARELIAAIDEEADRLDRLIQESLNLARIEGARANPRSEACSIPEIVDKAIEKMARYMGRREFIIEIPEDLPQVTGDRFLLEQMLLQFVDNAWKYSQPGARIRISGAASDGNVVVTVQNEGSEIPEGERERIFDKFYRGTRYRTRIEGTGLGLAIARTIAEAFRGKVWLEMESEGPAFHFALPAEAGTGGSGDREAHYIASR
jgi:two-component system sensor histidine kinase KdpD